MTKKTDKLMGSQKWGREADIIAIADKSGAVTVMSRNAPTKTLKKSK